MASIGEGADELRPNAPQRGLDAADQRAQLACRAAMPCAGCMQTVIETESYLRAAKDAQMDDAERNAAVELVATDPKGGDRDAGHGRGPQGPAGRPRKGQVRTPSVIGNNTAARPTPRHGRCLPWSP